MSKDRRAPWARWVAVVTGALVALKASAFVVSRVFRFAKGEVHARGGDVTFVLGLADRRKHAQGHPQG